MSLATRCPACSTVFRVVQDQLRVSEGWVRCGQCQEVFNALETLFDLGSLGAEGPAEPPVTQTPTPAVAAAPVTAPGPASPELPATAPPLAFEATPQAATATGSPDAAPLATADELGAWEEEGPRPEDHWDPGQATLPMSLEALAANYRESRPAADAAKPPPLAAPPSSEPQPESPVAAGGGVDMRLRRRSPIDTTPEPDAGDTEDADTPTPSRFIGPVPDWAQVPANGRRSKKKSRRPAPTDATHAQPHVADKAQRRRRKPEFVRQAERAALWRRPMIRATLGIAATLLATLLLGQVAYQYRDPLAARSPALAPALQAGCAWLGCRIGAPRALERIRLDASDLTRTDEEQVLRFTADLHNTADHAVHTPALDLSFTDSLGQVVSRKVLLPAELGARSEAIPAEGQWRVDARLAIGDLRIAGYTVEVFYP
ncbi:MAG: DUF3426 domain-containing protein [Pseudomonadota bacterium]